jgi:hypothetical protein
MAAGAGDRGHLRASHADREQVIGTLKAAFVRGILGKDEFDLRVGQTLASRTCAELAAVTADLPAGLTAAQPPQPAGAQGKARVLRSGAVLTAATVLYAAMWPLALSIHRNMEGNPVTFAHKLVVLSTLVYVLVAVVAVVRMQKSWQGKRSADSDRGGQHLARAVRCPGARHQAGQAGSSRRPVTVTPPKRHEGVVFPGRHCRVAATAPVTPSPQGRPRQAGDCGPGPAGQHQSRGSEG